MSFRARLTLFFLLIVVLPMIAVAVLVGSVASESATGKADAALSEDLEVASSIYADLEREAQRAGRQIGSDPSLAIPLDERNYAALGRRVEELARQRDVVWLRLERPNGRRIASFGNGRAFAATTLNLVAARRRNAPAARLTLSVSSRTNYVELVAERTGEQVALLTPGSPPLGTISIERGEVPEGGQARDLELDGEQYRVGAVALPGSGGSRVAITAPTESGGFLASRPVVAVALAAFIIVALLAAAAITRTLQGQIAAMLAAARRIGKGDFSGEVPVVGNDEMAGLASEFNEMRDRLREQMDMLRRQQSEIDRSVRRIGAAFASGLDREALLEILADTAVGACDADYGIVALSGQAGAEAEAGAGSEAVHDIALAAGAEAMSNGGLATAEADGAYALSSSIARLGTGEPLGVMTVARAKRAFSSAERDVFVYLVGQAAASVENVALHELVSEQARTDDLTGLANHRAFRDAIEKEAARALRFGHDLSLLIVDLDDFKEVNDTYGHLQGDAVLRQLGKILDEESRGIDEPARYGGEEFVVALPETGLEGALEVAERVRARIESEPVERTDGRGTLSVTASIGAATLPANGTTVRELIAAADAALYEAKRSGKNRVVAAPRPAEREVAGAASTRAGTRGRTAK